MGATTCCDCEDPSTVGAEAISRAHHEPDCFGRDVNEEQVDLTTLAMTGAGAGEDASCASQSNALAFVIERPTRFSISVLIGAVEADGRFDDVVIHELDPKQDLALQIGSLAERYEQVVLGYSFTTPNGPEVLRQVQSIRQQLAQQNQQNVTLVAGGPHPSGAWQQTLQMGFDVAVVGEGERSLPELLHAIYGDGDLSQVRGIGTVRDGETVYTGRSPRVENLDDYPPFAPHYGMFSSMEITRGCPWACRFCQATFLFGNRMRHRSVDNIAHWVQVSAREELYEIRFITPDAFAYGSDGQHLRLDLLQQMLKAVNEIVGREHTYIGSFPSEVRPETVSREAVDLIRAHAVNDNIIIGAQSGSDRLLELSHRGHGVAEIYKAVQITRDAGLMANVDFIFGMPGESEQDREQTRRVIRDLAAMGARIHSHAFVPLAGTPWSDELPGQVDPETQSLLYALAGTHQQYGQWRKQQAQGQEIVAFRRQMPDGPDQELDVRKPMSGIPAADHDTPRVIGLTGSIGTGKSTVLKMLAELGADVVDADWLAHQVMAPDGRCYQAVADAFGSEILGEGGQIDRRRLGRIVFGDPEALRRLEQLVHPAVSQLTSELLQATEADVVAIEAIRLVESGMAQELCDVVWIVTSEQQQQVERVVAERGLSEAEVMQRIAAQPSAEMHSAMLSTLGVSYVVIDNSGSLEDTKAQVLEAWAHLM